MPVRTGRALALAATISALVLAAACTVSGSGKPAAGASGPAAGGSTTAGSAGPSPGGTGATGSSSATKAAIPASKFVSPSGNIACSDFPATDAVAGPQTPTMTACTILSANFQPPDAATCPIQKTIIVSLPTDGPATISGCTGDRGLAFPKSFFELTPQKTLAPTTAYGDVVALKFARCTITTAHVECVSGSSRYGFDLAREGFTAFQR